MPEDYGIPTHRTVVVTGPRYWKDLEGHELALRKVLIREALELEHKTFGDFTLIHGNAYGLDRFAQREAEDLSIEWIDVPYFGWLRGGGGHVRNGFMLKAFKATACLGFHDQPFEKLPQPGSGTANCFKQALDLGIRGEWHNAAAGTHTTYPGRSQGSLL